MTSAIAKIIDIRICHPLPEVVVAPEGESVSWEGRHQR